MGVLNLTPDSFSDGGQFLDPEKAEQQLMSLIEDGATIIDIGGESTGPGSKDVTEEEELNRIRPVIDFIHEHGLSKVATFSIDTYKASVAEYALMHGFHMVNDVTALRGDPKMLEILLEYKPHVCLMYSKDSTARTTADAVQYDDVIQTVKDFLQERVQMLLDAGFPKENIIVDPGMGAFVSTEPQYSFEIIERLSEIKEMGYPILIGASRKSFLGGELKDRDPASVKESLKAIENGASIVRMHNVALLKEALSDK